MSKNLKILVCGVAIATMFAGCANESQRVIETPKIAVAKTAYHGEKVSISVGKFNNQTAYNNGVFSDGNEDRIGNQAQTILVTNLQQSGRFSVLDRTNLSMLKQESNLGKTTQNLKGAKYVITGDVVEFGRKTTGDKQLFGILGKGKTQVAHAKVNINVVEVDSAEVVYSTSGAGEFALSNREIIGFGGTAGYDATLSAKVLSLAISEAVNNLAMAIDSGEWKVK